MTVEQLKTLYTGIGMDVFQAEFWRLGLLAPKFKSGPLQEARSTRSSGQIQRSTATVSAPA